MGLRDILENVDELKKHVEVAIADDVIGKLTVDKQGNIIIPTTQINQLDAEADPALFREFMRQERKRDHRPGKDQDAFKSLTALENAVNMIHVQTELTVAANKAHIGAIVGHAEAKGAEAIDIKVGDDGILLAVDKKGNVITHREVIATLELAGETPRKLSLEVNSVGHLEQHTIVPTTTPSKGRSDPERQR